MKRTRHAVAAASLLLGMQASAQEQPSAVIAPLPFASPQQRITPEQPSEADKNILSTKPPEALPWQQGQPAPVKVVPSGALPMQPAPAANGLPANIPFGRSTAQQMQIDAPVGPAPARAVPVENIDHIEEKQVEAAPPTPPAAGEDPVQDDPAMPTELTAPLFKDSDNGAPRTMLILALNKVTAQSQVIEGAPGKPVKFGQLSITPITCRISDATSQRDDAVLLDIKENVVGKDGKPSLMPRFKGWLYASSPSVNALEHPVYDISAVECKIIAPKPKAEDKAGKKADKKGGKK